MSYSVLDADGKHQGDLCTIQGMKELESVAGEALMEFLDTGEADAELAEEIKSEVDGDEKLGYLTKLFDGKSPFTLTNGVEEDEGSN